MDRPNNHEVFSCNAIYIANANSNNYFVVQYYVMFLFKSIVNYDLHCYMYLIDHITSYAGIGVLRLARQNHDNSKTIHTL